MTKRLFIMTIGKTHSGKTTFAQALKKQLSNSVVIDHEDHVEFLQSYYKDSLPKQGSHIVKNTISRLVLDYHLAFTKNHLIICNTNLSPDNQFTIHEKLFSENKITSVLIYFDNSEKVLLDRINESNRTIPQFGSVHSNFIEVFNQQKAASPNQKEEISQFDRADHIFIMNDNEQQDDIIEKIVQISKQLVVN